jgi:hypothetical protein
LGDSGLFLDFQPDEIIKVCNEDVGLKSYLTEMKRRRRKKKLNYYLRGSF